jgi:hypothetical protein
MAAKKRKMLKRGSPFPEKPVKGGKFFGHNREIRGIRTSDLSCPRNTQMGADEELSVSA